MGTAAESLSPVARVLSAATAEPSSRQAHTPIRLFISRLLWSFEKVRVEHAHLGDTRYRQLVAVRGTPDRFRRRCVIDAERVFAVGRGVGSDPGHPEVGVVVDHRATHAGADLVG